jgi:hypothetical protein
MAEKQDITNPRISVVTDKNIRNYFALFFFIGIVSIVIPSFTSLNVHLYFAILLPVIVMIIYMIIVFRKAKGVLANDQIGDSVYYLGFLLTLVALILALLYAANTDDTLKVILPKFGIALITTIFGLGARVYITAFEVSPEDVQDISETNLSEASVNLKTQLTVANETFRNSINSLSEELRTTLESHSNQLSIFLKKNAEEFANSSKKIINSINEASDKLTNQATQLEGSLTKLNSSTTSFIDSITSINQEVGNIGNSFKDLNQINISQQLRSLNQQLIVFGNTIKEHNSRMTDLKDVVESDVSFLKEHRTQLQSSIEKSRTSIDRIQDNLVSLTKVVVDKLKD